MNSTYNYIEVLLADAREWRALGHLIDKVEPYFNSGDENAIFELGYASHPMQDLTGHSDDYVKNTPRLGLAMKNVPIYVSIIPYLGWSPVWHHGYEVKLLGRTITDTDTGADDVDWDKLVKHGIRYYHWDDVMWSRDLTYDMLGRFSKKYKQ